MKKSSAYRNSSNCRKRNGVTGAHRNQEGGILLFASAMLIIAIMLLAPITIFFCNLSNQLVVNGDTMHIAKQTAKVMDDHRFWLEAPRPGFDESKARRIAESAARSMCESMGMSLSKLELKLGRDSQNNLTTECLLEVDARRRFPLLIKVGFFDMNAYFTGAARANARTNHAAEPAYALVHMDAPNGGIDESHKRPLGFNQRDVAVLPAYGFFYNAVAGETKNPTAYGNGLAKNLHPENFMAMNHYHFKKSDLDHTLITGEDVFNNGWHVTRLIDGKEITIPNR